MDNLQSAVYQEINQRLKDFDDRRLIDLMEKINIHQRLQLTNKAENDRMAMKYQAKILDSLISHEYLEGLNIDSPLLPNEKDTHEK